MLGLKKQSNDTAKVRLGRFIAVSQQLPAGQPQPAAHYLRLLTRLRSRRY